MPGLTLSLSAESHPPACGRRLAKRVIGTIALVAAVLMLTVVAITELAIGSPRLRPLAPWVRGPALTGRVTDMATGQPIAGARISAAGFSARSGADGWYRLDVPPGRFRVRFEASGYSGGTVLDQAAESGLRRLDLSLPPIRASGPETAPSLGQNERELRASAPEQVFESPLDERRVTLPATIRVLMPAGDIVEMDTEEYVKGVVPAEMGYIHRRPLEALKAQAIAARTYAASGCLADSAGDPNRCEPGVDANVDTTTRTQLWRPIHYDIVDAAVEATRGHVIVHDGTLIRALYFARTPRETLASEHSPCCGGRRVAYLRAASSPDAFDERRGHGAGLSQEGAAVFADWGASAHEIIEHYYTDCRVVVAAPAITPTATAEASPTEPGTATTVRGASIELRATDLTVVRGESALSAEGIGLAAPGLLSVEGPRLEAQFPFTAVGVSWSAFLPPGTEARFAVRTSADGVVWSAWREVPPDEDAKDAEDGEQGWSRLLISPGRHVQVAARLRAAAQTAGGWPRLSRLTVHYIDGDPGPDAPLVADSAGRIISRAEWGANERLRYDAEGQEIWPPEYIVPQAVIVHHTVTENGPADPAAVVRSIYYYHAVSRGWGDIGYNYLVDERGNVYEGRFGGEVGDKVVAGGHAREYNSVTLGVALLGTFTSATPNEAMLRGLIELLAAKGVRFGIRPFDPVVLLDRPFAYRLLGHRDVGQTVCPGDGAYSHLAAIRRAVSERMAEIPVTPPPVASPTATPRPTWRPTLTPTFTVHPVATSTPLPRDCQELIIGGGFEFETDRWLLHNAFYTQYEAYRGRRSLFVGLRPMDPDEDTTYSTAIQAVRLPARLTAAELSFAARAVGDRDDARAVRLLNEAGAVIGPLDLVPAVGGWQFVQRDVTALLAPWAGQEVRLYFSNINNGDGERSFLRLDEVSLVACSGTQASTAWSPTPTVAEGEPTVSPSEPATAATYTPTLPATPPSATPSIRCLEAVRDGSFGVAGAQDWKASGGAPVVWPVGESSAAALGWGRAGWERLDYAALDQRLELPLGIVTATLRLSWRAEAGSIADRLFVELRRPALGVRHVVAALPVATSTTWQREAWPVEASLAGREHQLYLALLQRPRSMTETASRVLIDDISLRLCYRPTAPLYLPAVDRWTP